MLAIISFLQLSNDVAFGSKITWFDLVVMNYLNLQ